ncbi:basic blue protein [Nicotiana sylvestris]|uniref:Basic blue protein-like n=1 Tax=Nicotiana sylvestris TaxID=4096 RepID=A0A1U7YKX6_NICSY|nr:PREDICTED: basic blue protein-like [Nicotiana sylvestris]
MEALRKSLLIFAIIMTVMIQNKAMAAQHVVGGSQGWDESTDFNAWASGETFKVGDTLVFRYNPGLHSVVEVEGESAYKSCDTSSSVNSMSAGNDVVKLNKPGTRYFACGTAGHCDQGMKLKITTVTGNAPSNQAATSSNPSSSSAADSRRFSTAFFTFIAAIFTLHMALVFQL